MEITYKDIFLQNNKIVAHAIKWRSDGNGGNMLYKLDQNKRDYSKAKRVTLVDIGWKELDLQRLMSSHIQDFIYSNDLLTIFNERLRQEEPDILAIDRNGDLYILELKRWSSDRENLLQVKKNYL